MVSLKLQVQACEMLKWPFYNFVIGFIGMGFDYPSLVLLVSFEIILAYKHGWMQPIYNFLLINCSPKHVDCYMNG
jgi:hypothetical protein